MTMPVGITPPQQIQQPSYTVQVVDSVSLPPNSITGDPARVEYAMLVTDSNGVTTTFRAQSSASDADTQQSDIQAALQTYVGTIVAPPPSPQIAQGTVFSVAVDAQLNVTAALVSKAGA